MTREKVIEELKEKMALLPEFGKKEAYKYITWKNAFNGLELEVFQDGVVMLNVQNVRKTFEFSQISAINITDGKLQIVTIETLE